MSVCSVGPPREQRPSRVDVRSTNDDGIALNSKRDWHGRAILFDGESSAFFKKRHRLAAMTTDELAVGQAAWAGRPVATTAGSERNYKPIIAPRFRENPNRFASLVLNSIQLRLVGTEVGQWDTQFLAIASSKLHSRKDFVLAQMQPHAQSDSRQQKRRDQEQRSSLFGSQTAFFSALHAPVASS